MKAKTIKAPVYPFDPFTDKPSDPAKALPETLRGTLPNDGNLLGTFVIFCFAGGIEIKARGLSLEQLQELFEKIPTLPVK